MAQPPPCGVLLTNLGTPDAPTRRAVRRYLAQFLSDPRVIEAPRWLWWLVLHGIILRIRPGKSVKLYKRVWQPSGSPLLSFTRDQATLLGQALASEFATGVHVAVAMRYGNPSIASGLEELSRAGVKKVLVLPLYPQYSAATVASTLDATAKALSRHRVVPELRFVNGYHDRPAYIEALAESIKKSLSETLTKTRLLFSFHGLPQRYVDNGDPYQSQCETTAFKIAGQIGLESHQWAVAYQSRVGREEWLRPYTDEVLEAWARTGTDSVAVVCAGFAADCLETLDEIDREARETFKAAGGRSFRYVHALNTRPEHISMLADLVLEKTHDWRA